MEIYDSAVVERFNNLRFRVEDIDCAPDSAEGLRVHVAMGDNALCGDTLTIAVSVAARDGRAVVQDVRYAGYGCSLCLATADVLAEQVRGMGAHDAARLALDDVKRMWGGLNVGRARRDCVDLPVRTLRQALQGEYGEDGQNDESRIDA